MLEPCGLPFDWHLPPRSTSAARVPPRRLSGLRQRLSMTFGLSSDGAEELHAEQAAHA
jgi:hypothetical protein